MDRGIFPDSLEAAKVIPLPKKCAAIDVSDFRSISVLPMLSKIYDHVAFNRLYDFI